MGPDILAFGVAEMQDLVFTPESKENGLGTMNSQRWEEMVRVMEEVELIRPGAVRPSSCFTLEFIR
jgi:hypothetical protein